MISGVDIQIEVKNLHKSFGDFKVHKGIDLLIPKGAITVILGPSGTGKSVLLKQIMGLIMPDKGEILVDGVDITKLDKKELVAVRKKFGMLFQNAALFDSMNVYENVAFPLREHTKLKEKEIRDIVIEKLRVVGLKDVEYKMPSELSGGMRKRVGLARAIALEPDIILYDEPTTGLDPIMKDVVDNLIYNTQKKLNITSVVISHDIDSTIKIADYVAMIYDGKTVINGTIEDLRTTDNPYVQQFLSGSMDGPIKIF
ncbi:MAG: phospholipid/cholesterol/gamma-HCH transport system ATP-binding protein [Deferribacteres bacterium]|jgi:phospholipid/cholesterol/gamma-HCH transport system ATP-binding protein|nr:transporter related protein [Deferribacteraceae bacterium]MDK2793357.1 phospholipid/cholesterol/gamma-HCH transport system ATP-binding protein [Deferribacteres bacterium]